MAGEGNWYDLRVYVGNIGRYNEGSLVGGWATLMSVNSFVFSMIMIVLSTVFGWIM